MRDDQLVGIVVGVPAPLLTFVVIRAGLVTGDRFAGNPAVGLLIGILTIAWMFGLGLAGLVILEAVIPTAV